MSTKKYRKPAVEETPKSTRSSSRKITIQIKPSKNDKLKKPFEYVCELNSADDDFQAEFSKQEAVNERARVMAKSRSAANSKVRRLHWLCNLAVYSPGDSLEELALSLQLLAAALLEKPDGDRLEPSPWSVESAIGRSVVKLMKEADAPKKLRALADLIDRFPATSMPCWNDNARHGPRWFMPTLQDGLKAVMLGAFFSLTQRKSMNLPSIGELDYAIRHKWKWSGGDKELRDARRELGLSGLPRAKSGRPKQRGKK